MPASPCPLTSDAGNGPWRHSLRELFRNLCCYPWDPDMVCCPLSGPGQSVSPWLRSGGFPKIDAWGQTAHVTQPWCPLPQGVDCRASPSHPGKGPPYFCNLNGCHAPIVLALHLLPLIRVPWLTQMPMELAHPTGLSSNHMNSQGFSLGRGTISGSFLNSPSLVSQTVKNLPAMQKSWV